MSPPLLGGPVTVIGPGATFRGELRSSGPVEVGGTIEGDAFVDASFVVRESGRVLGNIDAVALTIAGEVVAGMLTAEKIDLRPTARVSARLRARVISIADGAFFDGTVEGRIDEAPRERGDPAPGPPLRVRPLPESAKR